MGTKNDWKPTQAFSIKEFTSAAFKDSRVAIWSVMMNWNILIMLALVTGHGPVGSLHGAQAVRNACNFAASKSAGRLSVSMSVCLLTLGDLDFVTLSFVPPLTASCWASGVAKFANARTAAPQITTRRIVTVREKLGVSIWSRVEALPLKYTDC